MMDNSTGGFIFIVGLVVGLFVMGLCKTYFGDYATSKLIAAREQCEKSLPRDQICVINYIPEKEKS